MKCPRCKKGKIIWVPPPEDSPELPMNGFCSEMECDFELHPPDETTIKKQMPVQ